MRARLTTLATFSAFTIAVFVLALAVLSRVRVGEYSLLQCVTHVFVEPGGEYQSLRRFREAETYGDVDIVFLGSSHAYRGFDPRIFAAGGHRSFNLGSTNQTPLNSYFIARRYLPKLKPELVVFEVYDYTLTTDGLEATRDLTVNTPPSSSILEMAILTWNLGAMTFAVAKNLGLAADETRIEQTPIKGETYVSGGYCESTSHRSTAGVRLDGGDEHKVKLDVRNEQIGWLRRASKLAQEGGARVVWVVAPTPVDHRHHLANLDAVRQRMREVAKDAGIPYLEFDDRLDLDPVEDFADEHHLSASGVSKFNAQLIADLRSLGYLPAAR